MQSFMIHIKTDVDDDDHLLVMMMTKKIAWNISV